jgi:hypothetical protein
VENISVLTTVRLVINKSVVEQQIISFSYAAAKIQARATRTHNLINGHKIWTQRWNLGAMPITAIAPTYLTPLRSAKHVISRKYRNKENHKEKRLSVDKFQPSISKYESSTS